MSSNIISTTALILRLSVFCSFSLFISFIRALPFFVFFKQLHALCFCNTHTFSNHFKYQQHYRRNKCPKQYPKDNSYHTALGQGIKLLVDLDTAEYASDKRNIYLKAAPDLKLLLFIAFGILSIKYLITVVFPPAVTAPIAIIFIFSSIYLTYKTL